MKLDNLRILHISSWKVPCGIATYCDNLVRTLADAGVHNSIAALHSADWKHCLPNDVTRWRETIFDQAREVDLVHIQHEHGLFGYSIGNRFAVKRYGELLAGFQSMGKPVVTTFHTDICTRTRSGLRGKWDRMRRRRLWGRYVTKFFGAGPMQAKAIVHSNATRKSFVKHGFPVESVQVIPHACLAPRTFALSKEEAKHDLGFAKEDVLLSIFGFVGKYKGHDLAVAALERLPANYHLLIVGGMHPEADDDFLDRLLASIPESLQNRVHITGWVDRETADKYFAATDVCLAPYRRDTQLSGSGAITWGLSSGRPVIASKIEAFQNVDRLGNCLFLVTPEKTHELSWAIEKLVSNAPLSARLVENATRFSEGYSWSSTRDRIAEVYGSTLLDSNSGQELSVYPSSKAA